MKASLFNDLYPKGLRHIVFFRHDEGATQENDQLCIAVLNQNREEGRLFKEELSRLKLTVRQEKTLVNRIFQAMLKYQGRYHSKGTESRMWFGAIIALRHYEIEAGLRRKIIAAALIRYGKDLNVTPNCFARVLVPEKLAVIESQPNEKNKKGGALQLVIDYMLEIGFTDKGIYQVWQKMLDDFPDRSQNFSYWWKGVHVNGLPLEQNLVKQVTEIYGRLILHHLNYILFGYPNGMPSPYLDDSRLEYIQSMLKDGLRWCESQEGKTAFEEVLIQGLCCAEATRVCWILSNVGCQFGLWSSHENQYGKAQVFTPHLCRLIKIGIERADKIQNFGVACALAEYVGDIDQADKLRIKARHFNQRVILDHLAHK